MLLVTMTLVVAAVALVFVCSPPSKSGAQKPFPTTTDNMSALSQAQQLTPPEAKLSYGGEAEHNEWWDDHEELLQQARREWGRRHPELYELDDNFVASFLNPDLVRSLSNKQSRNQTLFVSLFRETAAANVYTFQLLTPSFVQLLREELAHQEASGIPLRRPNGMNRYGAILSDLGFSDMMDRLVADYLVIAARHLFPNHVGPDDITHSYPFTVNYQPGQDVKLAEHTDASTVTINICLQPSAHVAPVLYFKEQRTLLQPNTPAAASSTATYIDLTTPGEAVIHLGQHVHGVSNVDNSPMDSPRQQLVVWLFGEHGYVRTAPYEPEEVEAHVRAYESFWDTDNTGWRSSASIITILPGDVSEL
jgi:hypothetical protein